MTKKNLLKGLSIPKTVEYSVEDESGSNKEYAKIVAYPFERGFGTSIGNTLRRILLSSIQGYAVSALIFNVKEGGKFKTISNEFEPLKGVKEDILEIIANIKKLALKSSNADTQVITISCKGPGELKGSDFSKNGFEVINKDLHILTMEDDCEMEIEAQIDFGRGYISGDSQKVSVEQYGVITIDSLFSPVVRVNYSISEARVGQRSDFEKLTLEVWTNGTISAIDAVGQSAFIASEFLQKFVNFDKSEVLTSAELDKSENEINEILQRSIESLEFSARTLGCFKRMNIVSVAELVSKSEDELRAQKNFGDKAVSETKEKLASLGLNLGMKNI